MPTNRWYNKQFLHHWYHPYYIGTSNIEEILKEDTEFAQSVHTTTLVHVIY